MNRHGQGLNIVMLAVAIVGLLPARAAWAQKAGNPSPADDKSATELAKETQNPIADLISVPFQNNFNFGAGADRSMIGA